jgi:putative ABC transport system ATP-binding protein
MSGGLQLRGLAKAFDGTPVFAGVELDVAPGEVVALLGESGVGKSTLLHIVAGLEPASAGSVTLDGTPVSALGEAQAAHWRRQALGFVFQAFHLLPHLSVAHNVALPLLLRGAPDDARVEAMLDALGLAGFGARLPRTLSGGQLQRVAIARALVHRPALVLADEPTGNLDAANAERVLALLTAQVRAQGSACLLVTHSAAAARAADRVLELTAGGIVLR